MESSFDHSQSSTDRRAPPGGVGVLTSNKFTGEHLAFAFALKSCFCFLGCLGEGRLSLRGEERGHLGGDFNAHEAALPFINKNNSDVLAEEFEEFYSFAVMKKRLNI
jgi:hypothetical protein